MTGPSTSGNNAVIAIPGTTPAVAQYSLIGVTTASIIAAPSNGTTNMAVVQAGTTTTMTWSRDVDNGDSTHAQISLTGPTFVIWAFGSSNAFVDTPLPAMSWASIDFTLGTQPSITPTATPNASPSPSPFYPRTVKLNSNPSLVLQWDRTDTVYRFRAVLNALAWYVSAPFHVFWCQRLGLAGGLCFAKACVLAVCSSGLVLDFPRTATCTPHPPVRTTRCLPCPTIPSTPWLSMTFSATRWTAWLCTIHQA